MFRLFGLLLVGLVLSGCAEYVALELAVNTAGLYLLPGGPILLGAVYGSIFKDFKNDSECDGSYVKATKKFIVGLLF